MNAPPDELQPDYADDDAPATTAVPHRSWGMRLRELVLGPAAAPEGRLEALAEAIAQRPAEPSNYVLRGELYLTAGEAELALADFDRAIRLAHGEYERRSWGIIAQTLLDRAEIGQARALRRLHRKAPAHSAELTDNTLED